MLLKTLQLAILLSVLSACGGGGGGSSPAPVPPPAPIVLNAAGLSSQMLADNRIQVVFSGTNTATGFCVRTDSATPAATDACFTDQTTQSVPASGSATAGTVIRAWTRTGTTVAFHQQLAGPGKTCSAAAYSASTSATSLLPDTPAAAVLPTVCLITDQGEMVLVLENAAPTAPKKTVANFLRYVNEGFYNNTCFHRITTGSFKVIQGGGFTCPLTAKAPGYVPIALEKPGTTGLNNLANTIAMARTTEENSATAGFFINVGSNSIFDNPLNSYAVFGRVVHGQDTSTLAALASVPVKNNGQNELSQPVTPPAVQWAYQIK